jgi:hypothetical protein
MLRGFVRFGSPSTTVYGSLSTREVKDERDSGPVALKADGVVVCIVKPLPVREEAPSRS